MRRIGPIVLRNLRGVAVLVALALGGGCGDPVPVATTIRISPETVVLEDVGETAQLTATVRDQNGGAMTDIPVAWTSVDDAIAAVAEAGLVTGRAVGKTTVRASAGGLVGDATIEVELGEVGVLHELYRELGGDGWRDDSNWLTDAPLFRWYGVRTEDSMPPRGVTTLSLYENGLTGSLPPEVGEMQTLRFLVMFGNRVTGSIPPEIGRLRNLVTLWLAENQLTGSIPSELENLRNMRFLNLEENGLTGTIPPEFGSLQVLEALNLSSNGLTGSIPPELGSLPQLEWFYLSDNELTGSIPPELRMIL